MKNNFKFKNWFRNRDFSKITPKFLTKITTIVIAIFVLSILLFCLEIYVPLNPISHETITYTAKKGLGDEDIARDLEKLGIIRSNYFFRFYVVVSLQHSYLQAGKYNLSPKMSTYQIVKKMVQGDVIKEKLVILEGQTVKDVGEYLESKGFCSKDDFIKLAGQNYSNGFDFLSDKPNDVGLEGYLFPDTYEISEGEECRDILDIALANFGKKLTPELRAEIANQNKSIFDIVTMASIIEKEIGGLNDKKIVSSIFWNRIRIGMPLQSCATVNYVTGKSDRGVLIKDTKIDSPYNTYMYKGLPKGPISNPGVDSIIAAIYPKKTQYLFYLSGVNGETIFSKTAEEHNAARKKYLK